MSTLEIIGSVAGIIGTIILSTKLAEKKKWRLRVFIAFMISNVCLIFFAYFAKAYGLLTMQAVFFLTSINGIRNNL